MKKILTAVFVACLSLIYAPSAFSQDNNTAANHPEDDMPGQDSSAAPVCTHPCIAIGPEIGLNIANYVYGQTSNGGGISASDPIVRGRIGGIVDIPIHGIFYIQPGIFYVMNGASNTLYANTWNVNTIEVPANLILKFGKTERPVRYFVGAGPYVGYNVSGTQSRNGKSSSLEIGSGNNNELQPIDVGVGVNGGIELNKAWVFRLRYQQGITNLETNSRSTSINSVSYGVQVAYLFHKPCDKGPKPPHAPFEERVWDQ